MTAAEMHVPETVNIDCHTKEIFKDE